MIIIDKYMCYVIISLIKIFFNTMMRRVSSWTFTERGYTC